MPYMHCGLEKIMPGRPPSGPFEGAPQISRLTEPDMPYALELTKRENWGTVMEELQDLYFFDPAGNFILQRGPAPIATVFGTNYRKFGFIGNLIVEKPFRGRGYGKALMQRVIDHFEKSAVSTVLLDAVPAAAPLYESLGFQKTCRSLRLRGPLPLPPGPRPERMRHIAPAMWDDLVAFDAHFFQASREKLLAPIWKSHPELCYYLTQEGQISGYILASYREGYIKVGPWVASPAEPHPEELLHHVLDEVQVENRNVYLGVLEANATAVEILQRLEIPVVFASIRMIRGNSQDIPSTTSIFALAGPDRG